MKCYRCNYELEDSDEYCPKCKSKVVKLNKKKIKKNNNFMNDYYNFAVSCLITKSLSIILAFISIINLFFPWLLLSLGFSIIGLIKYNDKRNIKIIIIDSILIIIEILLFILFFKKIVNSF